MSREIRFLYIFMKIIINYWKNIYIWLSFDDVYISHQFIIKKQPFLLWYIDTLNLDILCFRIHFMKNFWKGNINFCSRLFLPNLSYYLYAPYIILNRISRKTQETEYVYSFKTKFSCRSYFTFSSNVINILEI